MNLRLSSGTQEVLKWTAFALMALDHVAALFWSGEGYIVARMLGRLAFPLFGALIAYNVVVRRVPSSRYLAPLALLGLVSQPVYALAFERSDLNIFAPLAVGVFALGAIVDRRGPWVQVGAVALVGLVGFSADYGLPGAVLVPAWGLVFMAPVLGAVLGLYAVLVSLNWGTIGAVVPLLVPALLYGAAQFDLALPRLPRWFGYAFYPAHLAILVGVRVLTRL